ncbi:CRAL/TRIO domain-containing protein [Neoconidiobolus thromboides FSU 785]|nr:CRAL/TRIO domain-containing protein [Neoconidiobolus thromboides FSU 785]
MEQPGRYHNLDQEQTNKLKAFYKQYYDYLDTLPKERVEAVVKEEEVEKASKVGFASLRNRLPKMMQKTNSEGAVKDTKDQLLQNEFRAVVMGQTQFDHPDSVMLRYIRARKWVIKDSFEMFTNAIQWFHTVEILKIKKEGEKNINMELFKKSQFYMQGNDKAGRPICHVIAKLHDPKALTMDELQNFILTVMESARLVLVEPSDTVTIVFDLSDMSMNNMDYNSVKFLISCLEKYYPECLGCVIALNAPWFFNGIWKVLSPLIDPVVAAKIKFLSTKELTEFIDPSQLRETQGGTGELDYEYIGPVEGEDRIIEDQTGYNVANKAFVAAWDKFDLINKKWANSENDEFDQERKDTISEMRDAYKKVDPYVRAPTVYHRLGVYKGYNQVDWNAVKKDRN